MTVVWGKHVLSIGACDQIVLFFMTLIYIINNAPGNSEVLILILFDFSGTVVICLTETTKQPSVSTLKLKDS